MNRIVTVVFAYPYEVKNKSLDEEEIESHNISYTVITGKVLVDDTVKMVISTSEVGYGEEETGGTEKGTFWVLPKTLILSVQEHE